MGDVWNIDIRELVDTIRAHAIPGTRILITTAPPCKDHSKIRDSPPGLQGQDGSLLQHMVDIEWSIRLSIPEHPIHSLMENVLPHDSIQEHFDDITDQWGTTPIVLDAADGHMVSRPRLWWNTIHWEPVQEMISSQTPWQLTWTEHPPYTKLHNPIAADLQPNIQMKGWETPNILTQGGLFHCLTTQAINDTGRPPPQHTDVDQATWARWEQGQRQFPPWQYRPQYLTREHQADWQPITPLQRERLMGFPDNYTQPTPEQPFDDRQRNTMLGNAWHLPTAIWLLFLLLIPTTAHIPRTPTMTALDQMTQAWLNNPLPFGPPPKMHSNDNMPQLDWQSHLRWARSQADSFYYPRPIDPTLMWAIQIQQDLHMPSIRQAVIQDIQHLIQQNREQTTEWHKLLPTHCRIAYQQPEMITQIPTLISLLERIQYPHTHTFSDKNSAMDSHYSDNSNPDYNGTSGQTTNTPNHSPSTTYEPSTGNTSPRSYNTHMSTTIGNSWQTKLQPKWKQAEWEDHSQHLPGSPRRQSNYTQTNTNYRRHHSHTKTPSLRWHSASNRQDPMGIPRFDVVKTGDARDTTGHVKWTTNHIITPQITTLAWHNIQQTILINNNSCGDTITMEHTDNCH